MLTHVQLFIVTELCAITKEKCHWLCFEQTRLQTFDINHQLSLRARSTSMGYNENMFAIYFQLKLLRSADVELNPGPLTDKEEIFKCSAQHLRNKSFRK